MPQMTATQLRKIVNKFPWDEWNKRLAPGLHQEVSDVLRVSAKKAAEAAGDEWDNDNPMLSKFATRYVGERITQLTKTTKKEVTELARSFLDGSGASKSVQELASEIADAVRAKYEDYEGYRALRIARTEVGIAQNNGTILGYASAGIEEVDVLDGTADEVCADANGDVWSLDQALTDPLGHPNCERAFSGRIPTDDQQRLRIKERHSRRDWSSLGIMAAHCVAGLEDSPDPHGRGFDDAEDVA